VTALLDDRAALNAFWADNGYLFFRGVLSAPTVALVRDEIVRVLRENGFLEPGSDQPVWTGKGFTGFGTRPKAIYGLNLAARFFETPEVKQFLTRVLADEPVYLPIDVYRFTPPVSAEGVAEHMAPPHQDGFFNQGYNFRILWIPLMDVDERTGGVALAPGLFKRGLLHDPDNPPNFPIPDGAIADDAWARADYRAGDLLMIHPATPHGGLPNQSANLRLTMDMRIAAASDRCPVFGNVVSVSPEQIRLRARDGHEYSLALGDDTLVLPKPRTAIGRDDIATYWAPGDHAIVAVSDLDPGKATLVRKPSAQQYT
jgi:Phytanoyl-CoA dioxygenase (PhyH)